MPAYVINQFAIFNHEAYKAYQKVGSPTIAKHGGRVLAAGLDVTDYEGSATFPNGPEPRVIILEFDTLAQAKGWYESPEYQAAVRIRETCAKARVFIVDGIAAVA